MSRALTKPPCRRWAVNMRGKVWQYGVAAAVTARPRSITENTASLLNRSYAIPEITDPIRPLE